MGNNSVRGAFTVQKKSVILSVEKGSIQHPDTQSADYKASNNKDYGNNNIFSVRERLPFSSMCLSGVSYQ